MTAQFNELERRVLVIERAEQRRVAQLEDARHQVETLNEQLRLAQVSMRNVADLGARLDGIEESVRTTRGSIDEIRRNTETVGTDANSQRQSLTQLVSGIDRRVAEIERRTGVVAAVAANQIPTDNLQALSQARSAYDARDFLRARALAQAVIDRAALDPAADAGRVIVARTHIQENRVATGLQLLNQLITDRPSSPAAPEALAELSEGYVRLGWCTDAQRTLRLLTERHGATPQGQSARTRIEEVRRLPRTTCTR